MAWQSLTGAAATGSASLAEYDGQPDAAIEVTFAAAVLARGFWTAQVWATAAGEAPRKVAQWKVDVRRDLRDEID